MSEFAYRIHIGSRDFYEHEECWQQVRNKNINNLSDEQMKQDDKAYERVPLSQVPEGEKCIVPGCWKPIK